MKVLIAGIGNIFLGDDGFGVEVVRQLRQRSWPEEVRVQDFGIRGLDLAYAMLDDYDAVVLIDIVARGAVPGTLFVIEPELDGSENIALDAHGLDPVKVLALARALGAPSRPTYLVACEPAQLVTGEAYEDVMVELSEAVRAAVPEAVQMVQTLVDELTHSKEGECPDETIGMAGRDCERVAHMARVAGD